MAIPTQFSVAKTRKCPLANPAQPIDGANPLMAEDVCFISGASVLPAEAAGGIGTPSELSAQPVEDIDNASLFSALSVGTINNPSVIAAESVATVDNASVIDAESEASISTPTPLTANAATQTSGTFPLNHARILYNNLLFSYSSVTTTSGDGGALSIVPNTYQRWSFTSGSTESITITLPSATPMDTFCIGAHNLHSEQGASPWKFSYSSSTTGLFTAISSFKTPTSNAACMVHLSSPVSVRRLLLEVQLSPIREKHIGYISAGIALQMQRPFFNGHQPYTDSDVTEYYSNRTESGEIIGRQIRRRGYETTYEWQNIDDTWYRNNIPVFKGYAKKWPMFVAWNLLEYPDDVSFGETTGDIKASMQNGTRTKRTGLSFTLKGV